MTANPEAQGKHVASRALGWDHWTTDSGRFLPPTPADTQTPPTCPRASGHSGQACWPQPPSSLLQCGPEDRRACLCVRACVHVLVCALVSGCAYWCAFLAHVLCPRQTALAGREGQGCGGPVAAPPIMSQLLPLRKLFLEERWGLKAQIPCG